jgi:hypothetical protein
MKIEIFLCSNPMLWNIITSPKVMEFAIYYKKFIKMINFTKA